MSDTTVADNVSADKHVMESAVDAFHDAIEGSGSLQ